jgi:KDO2-lipid IV(A) lauroyltransferase
MNNKLHHSKFSIVLLSPRNWGVWLGFGILATVVNLLPYSMLLKLGERIGRLAMRYGKKRLHVATRNIELAFPEKSPQEVQAFVAENFKNTGIGLIETGITWFWPTWRFKRLIVEKDIQVLKEHEQNKQGVLLCAVHALNLEVTARAYAVLGLPGYGVFRPHDNPAYNFIQAWGRSHNGNALIHRKDLTQMIRVMRRGHRLFYLPDHDYGRNKSVFVPFFAVEDACTTTGTCILANTSKCAIVIGSGFRTSDGKYEILADESIETNYPGKDEIAAAAYMNQYVEKIIQRAPEQWMWLHRRFKTMADESVESGIRYR